MDPEREAKKCMENPLFREFYRARKAAFEREGEWRNTEPWHALAERSSAVLNCFASAMPRAADRLLWADPENRKRAVQVGQRIGRAIPYLWTEEMFDIARATPLPQHTISSELLPVQTMFWSWEVAYKTGGWLNDWVAVLGDGTGIDVVSVVTNALDSADVPNGRVVLSVDRVPYGKTWPIDFPNHAERNAAEAVIKFCAFLKSSIVESSPRHRMPRALRREVQRKRPEQQDEGIAVVRLRRKSSPHYGDDHGEVEWKHQWWVGGHFRAQWYPSLKAHKVIWIAPHLKGPRDKPLLERVYSVER